MLDICFALTKEKYDHTTKRSPMAARKMVPYPRPMKTGNKPTKRKIKPITSIEYPFLR